MCVDMGGEQNCMGAGGASTFAPCPKANVQDKINHSGAVETPQIPRSWEWNMNREIDTD